MGGSSAGDNLARRLRRQADEKHNGQYKEIVAKIYGQVTKAAEKASKDGDYSARIYHDELDNSEVVKLLKTELSIQGFNVRVAEDTAYSEHARQKMMYVEVSW